MGTLPKVSIVIPVYNAEAYISQGLQSLQNLFGIKGKRRDNDSYMKNVYNEYWVYPDEKDKPAGAYKVEGGCYWG